MPSGRKLLASQVEQIRLDYTDPERSVQQTADAAGVATSTVRALARQRGWERRRDFGIGSDQIAQPIRQGQGLGVQLATLERATSRSVLALDRALAAGKAADPERAARALASHVRTLGSIQKLQAACAEEPERDDETPPRTLAELRDELRRHLERISEEDEEESDSSLCGVARSV
jgi:hypothetical protein